MVNFEAFLQGDNAGTLKSFVIKANVAIRSKNETKANSHQGRPNNGGNSFKLGLTSNYQSNNKNPNAKPYKCFCQLYDQQGHTVKQCPNYRSSIWQSPTSHPAT